MDGWIDGWLAGCRLAGWLGAWMDGWMGGCVYVCVFVRCLFTGYSFKIRLLEVSLSSAFFLFSMCACIYIYIYVHAHWPEALGSKGLPILGRERDSGLRAAQGAIGALRARFLEALKVGF